MMKLILTDHEDHSEVEVMDGCLRLHNYTFDDHKQARAFCNGFTCARQVASAVVQSLPMTYEVRTDKPMAVVQQLPSGW
jgi:hypothetical protein